MKNSSLSDLFGIIKTHLLEFSELDLKIKLTVNADEIESLLRCVGYDFDEYKTISNGVITIRRSSDAWETGESPFYDSWGNLFDRCSRSSKTPKDFMVLDTKESSGVLLENENRVSLFFRVRKLLAEISDHCIPEEGVTAGRERILILVGHGEDVHRYDFSPEVEWEDLLEIQDAKESLDAIEKLSSAISIGDSQDVERISVLRSAFHELVNSADSEKIIFIKVLHSCVRLLQKYRIHHDVFVKKFSVNKTLDEINKKSLDFISKINESVSGNQMKALAAPGALIVIGAVMKIDSFYDAIAVLLGMFLTSAIIFKSILVYSDSFLYLREQVDAEFDIYNYLSEENEVRVRSHEVKMRLLGQLDKAGDSLVFIRQIISVTMIVTTIYVFVILYHLCTGN